MSQIKAMQHIIANINKEKGWYDVERTFGEDIALIHSEVSEALEEFRNRRLSTVRDENGKPVGVPSELADIIIRVLDLCERLNVDIEHEIALKISYNIDRPYRHGDKLL